MSNEIVSKSNYLIQASYRLTLQEQRLVLAALGQVNSRRKIKAEMTITVDNYATEFGINKRVAHQELYAAADRLYDRSIRVSDPEMDKEFRWIESKAKYHKGKAKVTIEWSQSVLGYISQLKNQFTSFKLKQVSSLKSIYSIRIFELLMQFKTTGHRAISVEDFRTSLKLEDKYLSFRDLNRWVIKPAIKELEAKSNLQINLKTVAAHGGRRITHLKFDFKENPQLKMDLG